MSRYIRYADHETGFTFVAGRKLRCNGARPLCQNCSTRQLECEYVPQQRRRGPGKANRGGTGRGPGGGGGGTEGGEGAAALRPYTSVLSLSSFTFDGSVT